MKKTLATLALLMFAAGAYSGTNKDTGEVCQGSTCNGGTGGAGQPVSVVVGNEVSVAGGGGGSDHKGTYDKYTPSAAAPSIDPTVPCAIPVTAGIGVPGLSASGGTAYIDEGCELRELIRIGLTSGNAVAEDKAAQLLNRQLDEALAESEEAVASGPASDAWPLPVY